MRSPRLRESLVWIGLACAGYASPQKIQHIVYEDPRVRILDVQVEAGEQTLLQRRNTDYVSIGPGDARIVFSRASSLLDRADGNRPSRQIVIEFLERQANHRNVCSEVLQGEYLHCHEPGSMWLGANLQVQFETDQTRVGILQIVPNASLAIPPGDVPPLLIALEGTEAEAVSRLNGAPADRISRRVLKAVEVFRSPADHVSEIRNVGKAASRFLVVEFGGAGE